MSRNVPAPNVRTMAKELGVSRTTVALALRNHPSVAEATRLKIQSHAERVGYRENPLVTALMTHVRSRRQTTDGEVIAYLTVGPTSQDALCAPTNSAYFAAAREQAEKRGFRLELFWLGPEGANARSQARVMRNRGIRGAILAPLPIETGPLALDWEHQSIVALGYSYRHTTIHRATHNHFTGIYSCYERLRQLGYHRIGLAMTTENDLRVRHYWLGGFLAARQVLGGGCPRTLFFDAVKPRDHFLRWFRSNRPDAIIGIHPDPAIKWLQEQGLRIPQDVGYAAVDLPPGKPKNPAGIRQSSEQIADAAVEILTNQIFTNRLMLPTTPRLLLIDGVWVDGPTVRNPAL